MERDLDAVFDVLQANEVIEEPTADVRPTSKFQRAVSDMIDCFERTDRRKIAEKMKSRLDLDETNSLRSIYGCSARTVAEYVTLVRFCDGDLTKSDRAWVVAIVDSSESETTRNDGSPDIFVPIPGRKLPFIEQFYEKSIVYVWLEDCNPCDVVKEDFEDIFDEPPSHTALFSVYGPDASALLQTEYDVTGGPVTLFFHDGAVDARLEGAQYRSVLENGIKTHRNL